MKQRILTGDRPTGRLHIGHYFGALEARVKLQDTYDTFVLIADVQALTDHFTEPEKVRENVLEVALDNLAVGIDPNISTFVIQSQIPAIAELTVFYSNLVSLARLQQNPTVKREIGEKEHLFKHSVSYGFLGYPISQAADITAFQADLVPVGEDQMPQLEQTREIVRKFNRIYGPTLKEPEAKLGNFPRVRGLDGRAKMSKSLANAIYLADPPEAIQDKVRTTVTDPHKVRKHDPGRPEVCTVYSYHRMFSQDALATIHNECTKGTRGCVFCKQQLAESIDATLAPIRDRRATFATKPDTVKELLLDGTARAKRVADDTLAQVKHAMGLELEV